MHGTMNVKKKKLIFVILALYIPTEREPRIIRDKNKCPYFIFVNH